MICRMWRGWTTLANANDYDGYLQNELFPRLEHELAKRGYRGYHVLRLARNDEVEFVTMVWFESLHSVQSFAGKDYERPVISEKAQKLLSRYSDRCDHYELGGFHWPRAASSGEY
jgi:heme-degrading monooxygenase HmoA